MKMKKTLMGVLIVAMLFAMSPLLVFADSGQEANQEPGSWGHYKAQYSSLLGLYDKVNPKHEYYARFATEIKEVKNGIEALFGVSFAADSNANENGVGGLIGESMAADADLVATDASAEAYPVTSRDIYDVYISAYNKLYVNRLGGITIAGYTIGAQNGRVAQWNSIKTLWNAPVVSLFTGGGLDTPEQAVIDADETQVIHVPSGECTNNSTSHRKTIFGVSAHSLGIGCTYNETIPKIVPTERALLLKSTGVVGIATSYINEKSEYLEAYTSVTEKNAAIVHSFALNYDEKTLADEFIAAAEAYAANYREVLIPNAKSDLDSKISSLSSRLDAASKLTFPDGPLINPPGLNVPTNNALGSQNNTATAKALPPVGSATDKFVTENPEVESIPTSGTPGSTVSPESLYSQLWIWGIVADLIVFGVVFLIILWRRGERIKAGEEIF